MTEPVIADPDRGGAYIRNPHTGELQRVEQTAPPEPQLAPAAEQPAQE
jgi:hypothetical protein